jgi:hypothetical protein
MKQLVTIILLWVAACATGFAQAKATFDKDVHDFGVVLWKHPATATFQVKNNGDKPLVISNVTTSCGCTVADWTKTPIAPGATGEVTSTFDAKALGHFYKDIGVYCNAADKPIYLTLRGEVSADPKNYTLTHPYEIGPIRLNKEAIEFDDANKGEKPTLEILVANTSSDVYTPVLMHLPSYLTAEATPERIGRKGAGKIRVTLDTDKLPKFGLTTTTIYLSRFPGDKVGEDNAIPVSAILLPDFSNMTQEQRLNPPTIELSAKELFIPDLFEKQKKSQNIVIKNTGKSDLEITDLQVFNSAIGVQLKKRVLKPGASAKLKITAYGKFLKHVKGTPRVLMITNDPNCPKIIINVNVKAK